MFVIREVRQSDLESIFELASFLARYMDSFNLPADREALAKQIEGATLSFRDATRPKDQSTYMFVLEDLIQKRIIGTSSVFGKHGTEDSPHTYLKIVRKKHRDQSTLIEKEHSLLRFEYDTDGPSEIGGLILHPDYRNLPVSLGKLLSYSRFMYMALHLDRFEREVIAELLPLFNNQGSSDFWDAFGRRFTGMNYNDADRLSRSNRDFIKNLFPQEDIYTCLFSDHVQGLIGQTGPTSTAVRIILEKIGFSFLDAVDPFDGGPHFGAKTAEITLIKRLKKFSISEKDLATPGQLGLVGFTGVNGFHCFLINTKIQDEQLLLSAEAKAWISKLSQQTKDIYAIPLM